MDAYIKNSQLINAIPVFIKASFKNITPLLCCFMIGGMTTTFADESCRQWTDELGNESNLLVGKIIINTGDVFDMSLAKESKIIHKFANKIHINTKPQIIYRQLLFKEGEKYQPRKLTESERLIRSNRYIKNVDISPYELCGKLVNIKVHTTDKWTLAPGASFSQSGGNSKSGIEIQEHNLLGLGKSLVLGYKSNVDRNQTVLNYNDPLFLGSRQNLNASIQDNSDGKGHELNLTLPFYHQDSRKAWGIGTSSISQDNSIYNKGNVIEKIHVKNAEQSAFWGWSKGLQKDTVNRFKVGWKYKKTDYKDLFSLTQSYPWFEFAHAREAFTTRTNFKSMGEIEDITLGNNYTMGIGLLRKEFGSTDNHLKLSASFDKGYEFENSLAFINMDMNSYLGKGQLQGERLNLGAEWYSFNEKGSHLYLSGKFNFQNNLQPDEQILLGGDSGLRGYPKGYQTGDKSIVFTAEKRFHYDWYPLNLAKFGSVIFTDVGSAWGKHKNPELLADVGVGLRVISTRSSITKALHVDLAFPLNGDKDIDKLQLTIKTRHDF